MQVNAFFAFEGRLTGLPGEHGMFEHGPATGQRERQQLGNGVGIGGGGEATDEVEQGA